MKRCANCREMLPTEYFTADKRRPDGRCPYCKVCAQMRSFLYLRRNLMEINAARRERYRANPEMFCVRQKVYRQNHPDRIRATRAKYKPTPEQRHAQYLRLRDATIERSRKWRRDNPGAVNRQVRAWYWRNLEHARLKGRIREGKRRAIIATKFDPKDLAAIIVQQDNRCAYCREALSAHFDFDHITPVSRGGPHTLENLCAACIRCNRKKHTMTGEEFLALLHTQLQS